MLAVSYRRKILRILETPWRKKLRRALLTPDYAAFAFPQLSSARLDQRPLPALVCVARSAQARATDWFLWVELGKMAVTTVRNGFSNRVNTTNRRQGLDRTHAWPPSDTCGTRRVRFGTPLTRAPCHTPLPGHTPPPPTPNEPHLCT